MRYLTKSRFKLALECPSKLYYTGKRKEYADRKPHDPFLQALAEGGFQVGELAKLYFPGGEEVTALDYDESVRRTEELLRKDGAVIYEGAFRFGGLFIRADIVVLEGDRLKLVEVKAKSFDGKKDDEFLNRNGTITASWKPYFFDVAFQKYVIENARPELTVEPFLMMADKSRLCPTDGLNQKFRVVTGVNGRKSVVVKDINDDDLSEQILSLVDAGDICDRIYRGEESRPPDPLSFEARIDLFARYYEKDEKFPPPVGSQCASCEFKTTPEDEAAGLKSGFRECWSEALEWTETDFEEPNVLDLWNYHHQRKAKRFEERRIKLSELTKEDVQPKPDGRPGITQSERQWLQVRKASDNDATVWIDSENLKREMDGWQYPLHFIDFETSRVAIPFNKGRRPYEIVAFQFSHHTANRDGGLKHSGEFLSADPGIFPNYDFVRELKRQLETDRGTVFRYAAHENSVLGEIYVQLREDRGEIPDRDELLEFIRSITRSPSGYREQWTGERNMVDMWELVKRYYYDPGTNGSTSIKQVLPAVLSSSELLRQKYSSGVYGSENGIESLNFSNKAWVEVRDGIIRDPYELLPPLFDEVDDDVELMTEDGVMKDGAAAMTAYARLQFEEMSDAEREAVKAGLLKYCELDTLAMAMIWEGWRDLIGPSE